MTVQARANRNAVKSKAQTDDCYDMPLNCKRFLDNTGKCSADLPYNVALMWCTKTCNLCREQQELFAQ